MEITSSALKFTSKGGIFEIVIKTLLFSVSPRKYHDLQIECKSERAIRYLKDTFCLKNTLGSGKKSHHRIFFVELSIDPLKFLFSTHKITENFPLNVFENVL